MVKTQTKLSQTLVLAYTRLSLEGREGRLWSTAKEVRADKLDSGGKGGKGELKRAYIRNGMAWGRGGGGSSERWVGPYPGFGDMW